MENLSDLSKEELIQKIKNKQDRIEFLEKRVTQLQERLTCIKDISEGF